MLRNGLGAMQIKDSDQTEGGKYLGCQTRPHGEFLESLGWLGESFLGMMQETNSL